MPIIASSAVFALEPCNFAFCTYSFPLISNTNTAPPELSTPGAPTTIEDASTATDSPNRLSATLSAPLATMVCLSTKVSVNTSASAYDNVPVNSGGFKSKRTSGKLSIGLPSTSRILFVSSLTCFVYVNVETDPNNWVDGVNVNVAPDVATLSIVFAAPAVFNDKSMTEKSIPSWKSSSAVITILSFALFNFTDINFGSNVSYLNLVDAFPSLSLICNCVFSLGT